MKYLVIDLFMSQPIRAVFDQDQEVTGNTRLLHLSEVPAYARWLAENGGRALLDAFELKLINDGVLHVYPINEHGAALVDECEAVEIKRCDDGLHIVWVPRVLCWACHGEGHFELDNEAVDVDDLCMNCDGHGQIDGHELETDIDGRVLADESEGVCA